MVSKNSAAPVTHLEPEKQNKQATVSANSLAPMKNRATSPICRVFSVRFTAENPRVAYSTDACYRSHAQTSHPTCADAHNGIQRSICTHRACRQNRQRHRDARFAPHAARTSRSRVADCIGETSAIFLHPRIFRQFQQGQKRGNKFFVIPPALF